MIHDSSESILMNILRVCPIITFDVRIKQHPRMNIIITVEQGGEGSLSKAAASGPHSVASNDRSIHSASLLTSI